MKYPVLVVGALCLGLGACASPNAGNPDGDVYVGSPGGTYDSAANPPRTNGTVTYNPIAALPPDSPAMGTSGSAMPPAMPGNTGSAPR